MIAISVQLLALVLALASDTKMASIFTVLAVILAVGLVLSEVCFFSPISAGIARSEVAQSSALHTLSKAPRGAVLTVPAFQHHSDLWRQTQHGQPTTGTTHHRRSQGAYKWLKAARSQPLVELQTSAEAAGIRYVLVHKRTTLRKNPNKTVIQTIQTGVAPLAQDDRFEIYALW